MDWDIREYERLDSTNLEARRLLEGGASPGLVVWCHHQTEGRGRLDRSWVDLPGKSLLVSLVLRGLKGFKAGAALALSVRRAVRGKGFEGPLFKWPNDLVYGDRKVGGILCETCSGAGIDCVIAGLGLNVGYLPGELSFPSRLPATSLLVEERSIWDRKALLWDLLEEIDCLLELDGGELLREYQSGLAYLGAMVRINPPYSIVGEGGMRENPLEGRVEGIDREGHLLVDTGGMILRLASGDIGGSGIEPRH